MPPRAVVKDFDTDGVSGVLNENDSDPTNGVSKSLKSQPTAGRRNIKLVWRNIILFAYLHVAAVYGFWLMLTSAQWKTGIFAIVLYYMAGLGITAGAHRLWAHRSYKANVPLKVILMLFNTLAFQDAAVHWARDHRVHHKYSETDADPHNVSFKINFIIETN
jgi:stearoyl-CoA desaturase (Delta-9 desaturase)